MKILNVISATLWGILLLSTIVGVLEPTRLMYGMAVGVLFFGSIARCFE